MQIRNKNSSQEIGASYQYWRDDILKRHVEENYEILTHPDIVDIFEIDSENGTKKYITTTDNYIAKATYTKDTFSIVPTSAVFDSFYRITKSPLGTSEKESIDISDSNNSDKYTSSQMKTTNKVFISHSSQDVELVGEIIEILEAIGLPSTKIFCSSYPGYGIDLGENFLERLKKELNDEIIVIFVLSDNFYSSPISLCEMGATWIKTNEHIPVLIPPFNYEKIKGVFPNTQGFKINESLKLNLLKSKIEKLFDLEQKDFTIWESKRDKILDRINKTLNPKNPERQKDNKSSQFEDIDNVIKMLVVYAKRNNLNIISFEKIQENINPKFDEGFIMNLVEENPNLISRSKLKNNRFGIKISDELLT